MNAFAAVANPASAPAINDVGIVRRFLAWAPSASPGERARAISALARAYLYCDLSPNVRSEAIVALTSVLDDPSSLARRALAEAFASAPDAPRHIVLALAGDVSTVSGLVLALSPLLSDAELMDCAAIGDGVAQTAIARRARLGAAVASALAEVGAKVAVLALAGNPGANLGTKGLQRILDRFRADAAMREALLSRPELPAAMRADIAAATADSLAECAAHHAWLNPGRAERIGREAREQAFVAIAASCSEDELADLVSWLRKSGGLTVALLMRALMSGDLSLFRGALVDMSGLPARRVAGFVRDWRGHGFASLYAKASLPAHFLPAFRVALGALAGEGTSRDGLISRALTTQTIRALEKNANPALAPIQAMLWRFASEAAREDAREFARESFAMENARLEPLEREVLLQAPPILVLSVEGANENAAPPVELMLELVAAPEIAEAA